MRDLFAEYVAEQQDLMGFYTAAPKALFNTAPRTAQWDPAVIEALGEYQESLGGQHRFMGDEAVIATGQQPGLFTGPLYTIYKAATAILLARKVHDRFGVRCIPVFWVASDDHDFDEAATAHLVTKEHELLTLTYQPQSPVKNSPLHRVPAEPSLHGLIDQAAAQAYGSDCTGEIAAFLHQSLDSSSSFADWMARILIRLFRDTPLVVFAPHLPAARRKAAAIMEQEVRDPLVSTLLLNRTGQRLKELDYHQQVTKGDNECNFFLELDGRRRKVVFENDRYQMPDTDLKYTVDEMVQLLESSPESFSPNVALRCISQQALFPVAAYVAGPSEIAYWGQLKSLFRHFGMDMPIVYPRASCTLTDIKLNKLLEKFQFTVDDLYKPVDGLYERALEVANRGPALEILKQHRPAIEAAAEPLRQELEPHNANAAGMVNAMGRRIAEELERIEAAIVKGDEEQAENTRRQVLRLVNTLAPNRKRQERVLNVLSFLFEHGWGLIPRLMKEIDVTSFEPKEIEL